MDRWIGWSDAAQISQRTSTIWVPVGGDTMINAVASQYEEVQGINLCEREGEVVS